MNTNYDSPVTLLRHYSVLLSMLFLCAALFLSPSAVAQQDMTLQQAMSELSDAKAQGLVGERQNGYLGVVRDEHQAARIVTLINDARRSEYTRIAEQNNLAVSDVEAMAGKRAIERTPAGQYIEIEGEWVVKR